MTVLINIKHIVCLSACFKHSFIPKSSITIYDKIPFNSKIILHLYQTRLLMFVKDCIIIGREWEIYSLFNIFREDVVF